MHLGHHLSDAIQITDLLPDGFAFNDINFFFFKRRQQNKTKKKHKKTPNPHFKKKTTLPRSPNPALVRNIFKEFSR